MVTSTSNAPPKGTPSVIKYEYMFEKNKSPTKQLDAFLRAIAKYISKELGDKNQPKLIPSKMAAFYKAVGGDYDSVFVQMDNESINYLWRVTGCQHTLQPTHDDFAPPSIPALTPRGFCRWQSLEVLLGPEEHVPYLQYAAKNWTLTHPETGELFPSDLPRNVFPTEVDQDVDRWHASCAADMWKDAAEEGHTASKATSPRDRATFDPSSPRGSKFNEPKFAYVHVDSPPPSRDRPPRSDRGRPFTYVQVPGRTPGHPGQRMKARSPERARRDETSAERQRRRSFSDFASPTSPQPQPASYVPQHLAPELKRPSQARHHSQPRHYSSSSSAEELVMPASNPRTNPHRRRQPSPPSPPRTRGHVPPLAPQPPSAAKGAYHGSRVDSHGSDLKRRNGHSPLGSLREKVSEKVSSVLGNNRHAERPRPISRTNSYNGNNRNKRSPHNPPSRMSRSYSELDSEDDSDAASSDDDAKRKRKAREERDRERDREQYRHRPKLRDPEHRNLSDDRDHFPRRDRDHLRRPESSRRTSSHADLDRRGQSPNWDARDSRGRAPRDEGTRYDSRRSVDERGPSPVTGVTGRRYPEPAY